MQSRNRLKRKKKRSCVINHYAKNLLNLISLKKYFYKNILVVFVIGMLVVDTIFRKEYNIKFYTFQQFFLSFCIILKSQHIKYNACFITIFDIVSNLIKTFSVNLYIFNI